MTESDEQHQDVMPERILPPSDHDEQHISPEAYATWRDSDGGFYEMLKRPDGQWGWRTVVGKEWCNPL